jgi:hypothetical protein
MPIMNTIMNIAKAGLMRRLARGPFGSALIALWAGKKMYNYVQARKLRRARVFG